MPAIRTYSKKVPKVNINDTIGKNNFGDYSHFLTNDNVFDKLLETKNDNANQFNKKGNEVLKPNIRATYNRNTSFFNDSSVIPVNNHDERCFPNKKVIYPSTNRTKGDKKVSCTTEKVNILSKVAKVKSQKRSGTRKLYTKVDGNTFDADENALEDLMSASKCVPNKFAAEQSTPKNYVRPIRRPFSAISPIFATTNNKNNQFDNNDSLFDASSSIANFDKKQHERCFINKKYLVPSNIGTKVDDTGVESTSEVVRVNSLLQTKRTRQPPSSIPSTISTIDDSPLPGGSKNDNGIKSVPQPKKLKSSNTDSIFSLLKKCKEIISAKAQKDQVKATNVTQRKLSRGNRSVIKVPTADPSPEILVKDTTNLSTISTRSSTNKSLVNDRNQHVTVRRSSKTRATLVKKLTQLPAKVHFIDLTTANDSQNAREENEEALDKVVSLIKVSNNVYKRKTKNKNTGNAGILNLSTASIQSGKWRRSLMQWRKSQKSLPGNKTRKSCFHRTVSIAAADTTIVDLNESSFYGFGNSAVVESVSAIEEKRRTGKHSTRSCRKTSVIVVPDQSVLFRLPDHRAKVLKRCGQQEPLKFDEVYSEANIQNCRKIGEGVYGEVFLYKNPDGTSNVLKIIPIAGTVQFNGEPQKSFEEILSEIVIAIELSNLRQQSERTCRTNGFVEVKRVSCVQGKYPEYMMELWELYRDNAGTENDHPEIFDDQQIYIVFELANAGQDLEAFKFENAEQAYSALQQTAVALGVAEKCYQFEHRDLHWGNILLAPTTEKEFTYLLAGKTITVPTYGVKATIIDFTLSRMVYDGCCLYNDLANDADLFTASGDYQFDIYRMMKKRVGNEWERYEPSTNVMWLHYVVDKMIDGARYRLTKSKTHKLAIGRMMTLRDDMLNYKSAFDYAQEIRA
jgi:serine/threonine-protein kinase haspin